MTTPSILQSKNAGPATRTTFTFSGLTTGKGNALVAILACQGSTAPASTAVTDNLGQTWTKLRTSGNVTGGRYTELWGIENALAVTSVTCANSSANLNWTFIEFGGVAAAAFDATNAFAGASSNTTTPCNVTPPNAGDLLFSYVHWNTNLTANITIKTGTSSGYALDTVDTIESNGQYALSTTQAQGVATGVTWSAPTAQGYGEVTIALLGASTPPPPSGGATATIVDSKYSGPATRSSFTFTLVNPTGNDHLLLAIMTAQGSTAPGGTGVSDGATNSWSKVANSTSGTGRYVECWKAEGTNPTSSITCVNTSANVGWQFLEIAGCPSSAPIDVIAALAGNSASATTACDVTPGVSGDMVISFVHANTNLTAAITLSTAAVAAGFVVDTTDSIETNGNIALCNGPTSGSPIGAVWNLGTAQGWGEVTIAIKNAIYKGEYKQPGGGLHKYTRARYY